MRLSKVDVSMLTPESSVTTTDVDELNRIDAHVRTPVWGTDTQFAASRGDIAAAPAGFA